ncbi:bifunctional salicylyl-CoA 5-hydroxylase/oxidoreductase [Candidatus Palauibacter polyketidifaciens]|uniref:bifunctional salicylyl-CoA 5-hydroxylase/oxidoreductase n=1 Tax=Candidatus Palauibacter polyketidifaciens TaxID=3056740 RepID=UPI002391CDD6|nr:bifunctional salicylyl-CoA 5-hydroxylase/oxidoreductase [Candidatus Palauibacter polyketidifaciens]MDE2720074.1 bifunctional salicylyl-CoA 5-hydroxylase/oxidoreductase [Candidatus Palauibacter polyketidifaciens]
MVCVGGGPAGLYFAILMKRSDPAHDVIVLERNRPGDTYGFGVVFSDATLEELAAADRESYEAITRSFHHWDDIDIHYRGHRLTSTGHGFSGLARTTLLEILEARARELGVDLRCGVEVESEEAYADADLVLAADGVNSRMRDRYARAFGPRVDLRPNRFVWLGTTKPFPAFTFHFRETTHGLWRVHAYQYRPGGAGEEAVSTFIVEATEATWRAAGMDAGSEEETVAFLEDTFREELDSHRLVANRSIWRGFPTVRNRSWRHGNIVLVGDAAHSAHFSIGSGTRLAMIDAISLHESLLAHDLAVAPALEAYETARRPEVESVQRAAQASLEWFEGTERFLETEPVQFAFNLITRSLRITHSNLALRDPEFTARVDRWFAERAAADAATGAGRPPPGSVASGPAPPPLLAPFRLRELELKNRVVVSAMCQYSAEDGTPDDWHLVNLGSRAIGGAGLVMSEMTDVSREGRISLGCTGMYAPAHVGAWKRIVDFVHRHSEAAIGMQLGHAGRKASTRLSWEGDNEPLEEGGWPIMAASPVSWFEHSPVPREMTRRDMDRVTAEFRRAAEMSEEAGFDLLEIHFAHGYLLASFISPLTNLREDEYGGDADGQLRFPLEVLAAVRAVWPAEKPISVRISAVDWAEGGMTPDGAVEVARRLRDAGVDIIDVSAGQTVPWQEPVYGRQYQTPFSDRIRHEAAIATMAVGNISSFMDVNTILAAGRADLCCLARAHLWDPYWTRHAAYASGAPIPWPPQYSSLDGYTPRFEWGY